MLRFIDNCEFGVGDKVVFEIDDKMLNNLGYHFGNIVDIIMEDDGMLLFKIEPIFKLSTNISYYYRTCGELTKEREKYMHVASENN